MTARGRAGRRRTRPAWLLVWVAIAVIAVPALPAEAATASCTRDGVALTIRLGDAATAELRRDPEGAIRLTVDGAAVPCDATVSSVDSVAVTGGAGPQVLTIDLAHGGLAPGVSDEPPYEGDPEIELVVDLEPGDVVEPGDTVRVVGTGADEQLELFRGTVDLNHDFDQDLTLAGVARFEPRLGGGCDRFVYSYTGEEPVPIHVDFGTSCDRASESVSVIDNTTVGRSYRFAPDRIDVEGLDLVFAGATYVNVSGGYGDDHADIVAMPYHIHVAGRDGADSATMTLPPGDLDLRINNDGGVTSVASPAHGRRTGGPEDFSAYAVVEDLHVVTGEGTDWAEVVPGHASDRIHLDLGDGQDTLDLWCPSWNDDAPPQELFVGGAKLQMASDQFGPHTGPGVLRLQFAGVERVESCVSGARDHAHIQAAPGLDVVVDTVHGADRVDIDISDPTLETDPPVVEVGGGRKADYEGSVLVSVRDTSVDSSAYTIATTPQPPTCCTGVARVRATLTSTAAEVVAYLDDEEPGSGLALHAGPGVDTIVVDTPDGLGTGLSVDGGAGGDTLTWRGLGDGSSMTPWPPDRTTGTTTAGQFWIRDLEVPLDLRRASAVAPLASTPQPALPQPRTVRRLAGADRVETAALLSADAFPTGAPTAFVVTSLSFPDALAAGPIAGMLGAPILLTAPDRLPDATARELERLRTDHVIVVGGHDVVGDAVLTDLSRLGIARVERIAGSDRFATAAAVSRRFPHPGGTVHVATGRSYPDALAAAAAAAAERSPILLIEPDQVPLATAAELAQLGASTIHLLGGPGAISELVELRLRAAGRVERIAGADRYETAVAIATGHVTTAVPGTVYLVSGENFPDALAAGAAAAASWSGSGPGRWVLLVRPDEVPRAVEDLLTRWVPSEIVVVGGGAAIADAVVRDLERLI